MTRGNSDIVMRTNEFSRNIGPRTSVESDAKVLSFVVENESPLVSVLRPTKDVKEHTGKYVNLDNRILNERDIDSIYKTCENNTGNVYEDRNFKILNKIDPHLHGLKEVVPPKNNNHCFSLRVLQSRPGLTRSRNVEMESGKVSNTFAKTARNDTIAKNLNGSPSQPNRFLTQMY